MKNTSISKLMSLEEYKEHIVKSLSSNSVNSKDIVNFLNDQYDNLVDSFVAGIDPAEFTNRYLHMLTTTEAAISNDISAADLNRAIKKYFKEKNIDVIANSTQTKDPYIRVVIKGDNKIPNEIRKEIAAITYKNEDFDNNNDIDYGNIRPGYITIKATQWIEFLNKTTASISCASSSKEFVFQETYGIDEEASDKENDFKIEKQILKKLKYGVSLKSFKINGVFDEGEAEVVVKVTGYPENIKKWWKWYGGNNENIKKGSNIVEASISRVEALTNELIELYCIASDEEMLAEEGENHIFAKIDKLTCELQELIGEENIDKAIKDIKEANSSSTASSEIPQPMSGAVFATELRKISDNASNFDHKQGYSYILDKLSKELDKESIMCFVDNISDNLLYVCFSSDNGKTKKHLKDITICNIDTMANEIYDWCSLKGIINMHKDSVASLGTKEQKRYDTLKRIVDDSQYEKINGVIIDGTTAGVALQVLNALNEENKNKLLAMPIKKMVDIIWKLVK